MFEMHLLVNDFFFRVARTEYISVPGPLGETQRR